MKTKAFNWSMEKLQAKTLTSTPWVSASGKLTKRMRWIMHLWNWKGYQRQRRNQQIHKWTNVETNNIRTITGTNNVETNQRMEHLPSCQQIPEVQRTTIPPAIYVPQTFRRIELNQIKLNFCQTKQSLKSSWEMLHCHSARFWKQYDVSFLHSI